MGWLVELRLLPSLAGDHALWGEDDVGAAGFGLLGEPVGAAIDNADGELVQAGFAVGTFNGGGVEGVCLG